MSDVLAWIGAVVVFWAVAFLMLMFISGVSEFFRWIKRKWL